MKKNEIQNQKKRNFSCRCVFHGKKKWVLLEDGILATSGWVIRVSVPFPGSRHFFWRLNNRFEYLKMSCGEFCFRRSISILADLLDKKIGLKHYILSPKSQVFIVNQVWWYHDYKGNDILSAAFFLSLRRKRTKNILWPQKYVKYFPIFFEMSTSILSLNNSVYTTCCSLQHWFWITLVGGSTHCISFQKLS